MQNRQNVQILKKNGKASAAIIPPLHSSAIDLKTAKSGRWMENKGYI
jgi:hypothetical protein